MDLPIETEREIQKDVDLASVFLGVEDRTLFESCPACGAPTRAAETVCRDCGGPVRDHRSSYDPLYASRSCEGTGVCRTLPATSTRFAFIWVKQNTV